MKILVGVDFSKSSKNAIKFASGLAKALDASITLVHAYTLIYDFAAQTASYAADMEKQGAILIRKWSDVLEGKGIKSNSLILQKNPSDALIQIAEEEKYDMIVIGSTGKSGLSKVLLGSTASDLIRSSQTPVLMIPGKSKFKHISSLSLAVAAKDLKASKFTSIIEITRQFNLPYNLIHINQEKTDLQQSLTSLTKNLQKQYPSRHFSFMSLEGSETCETLLAYCQQHPKTILVMVSKQQGFLDYLFKTSRCAQMAQQVTVPMLVLKAE
ncbi:hypothetical protein GCM10007049_20110 [Echinicola pacifica]|uniref:UspA domain-containing protein n=1 Tax=Echinicola pacifica TaxID=346377 RepID=A0A918PYE0_9BACT|nr:universal stress protein [Echinicola pacifica]GGZ27294.1 hypothetical protein GCM10007049_20110 [Echinicola pacifica]